MHHTSPDSRGRLGRAWTSRGLAVAAAALTAIGMTVSPAFASTGGAAHPADAPGAGPDYPVVASGLDNPRGLSVADNGDIYVAESGHGGDGACIPSGDDPSVEACFGTTGAIARIHDGKVSKVVTGLPSLAAQVATQGGQLPPGAQASGPSDVEVLPNGQVAFTVGLGSDPAKRSTFSSSPVGHLLGTVDVSSVPGTAADATVVGDIAAFEAAHNPVPPKDAPDSNANAVLLDGHDLLVVDAGGNDLLRVDSTGKVSLVAAFPPSSVTCQPPIPAQSVPTSVVRGPDGAWYVSELTGFPFCEGGASIYRVTADGGMSKYATGLTNVTGLAFGDDGTLYAVEIAQHGLQKGPIGAVVAIPKGGGTSFADYQVIAGGLFAPYGIAIDNGSAYVTTGSVLPAAAKGGEVIRIALPSPGPSVCHPFPDVTASNSACENIAWLKDAKITKPLGGNYHPLDSVTRGQMAAFLFRLTNPGEPSPVCTAKPFPDVATSDLFCGYITWAKDHHIAFGYSDGSYGPDRIVTRGAMAAFLYRITGPGHPAPACTSKPFQDVAVGDLFCGVITWAKDHVITYGIGDGTSYGTTRPVTRQAMASFLHRVYMLDH